MKKHMKPIIFKTDMVQAILDGRKTETRRPVKFVALEEGLNLNFSALRLGEYCTGDINSGVVLYSGGNGCWQQRTKPVKPPYRKGDILWVRETWCRHTDMRDNAFEWPLVPGIYYKADAHKSWVNDKEIVKWRPAIHMPREAARLFLRVVDVRVERLQDITEEGAKAEGVVPFKKDPEGDCWSDGLYRTAFQHMWNEMYGWNPDSWGTNPWVWVIQFERVHGLADTMALTSV